MIESSGPMSPFGVLGALESTIQFAGWCMLERGGHSNRCSHPLAFFFQLMVPPTWRKLRNSEGILLFFLFRVLFLVGGFKYNYTHTKRHSQRVFGRLGFIYSIFPKNPWKGEWTCIAGVFLGLQNDAIFEGSGFLGFQVIQDVTFWSPIWRSLNHLKGHLTMPKRSQRIARRFFVIRIIHLKVQLNCIRRWPAQPGVPALD